MLQCGLVILCVVILSGSAGAVSPTPDFGSLDWLLQQWRRLPAAPADTLSVGTTSFELPAATLPAGRFALDLQPQARLRAGQAETVFDEAMPLLVPKLSGPKLRWRLQSDLAIGLGDHFYLQQQALVDSQPDLDPASRTHQYRQIEASAETPIAIVGYRTGRVDLRLGRLRENWGPGWTGSLLLSPVAAAPDGISATVQGRRWRMATRFGRIDSWSAGETTWSRWLAAHRFEWQAHPRWRIAWSEAALVASDSGTPLWLANPVLPWALTQQEGHGADEPANILWSIDSVWRLGDRWTVYGQFLLDDFMLDGADRDTHPDQLGGLLGLLWSERPRGRPGWALGCEASRLGNWTYVHRNPLVRYRAWETSLGHPAGPGSETVTAFACRDGGDDGAVALVWARWYRRGRIWIGTPESSTGNPNESLPAPPRIRAVQCGAWWRPAGFAGWHWALGLGWTGLKRGPAPSATDPLDPLLLDPARGAWFSATLQAPGLRFRGG